MIPPEPDPPTPPEPVTPEYTYATSESVSLGSVSGTLYRNIQYNGSACMLNTTDSDNERQMYTGILLYEVDSVPYCYFTRGGSSLIGILGNNAEIGLTIPTYRIADGSVSQALSEHLDSSTPSDFFENVRTRNFTLRQR